ncbi:MAG: hypothetical protein E7479_06640 [Ruminococcaceae bacterium]|nr:hypothetical protein [Oscillospiraceae bacterium]
MEITTFSHRNAEVLFNYDEKYIELFNEVAEALSSITDEEIIEEYNGIQRGSKKSLSQPINRIIKRKLVAKGWNAESPIFNDPDYTDTKWRLDFAKDEIAIEVAFNHGEAISWNLLKPVMSSELNHIEKAIQTSAGIVICATEEMKTAGNFDSAVGTYEKFLRYLTPMYNILPSPILLIGLKAPRTFHIDHETKRVVMNEE